MNQNTRIRKYFIWLFWIAVWQTANMLIHNNIIFVGPLDMVKALLELVRDSSFWASIFSSFARISLGFLGAFVLSILLGCLAYAFPLIRELLEPEFGPLYVTPPDIDETVKQLSYTISEGIHLAFMGEEEE